MCSSDLMPYDLETSIDTDSEEPHFVPMDMSTKEIITDPEVIQQVEEEAAYKRARIFRSSKDVPFHEPWFSKKTRLEVEQSLKNCYHIDGYFAVASDFRENRSLALFLHVMCNDTLHTFKINQV